MRNIITILVTCLFLTGCVESSFKLADESRLPIWFKLPEGKTRNEVTVTLSYIVWPSGREATLELETEGVFFSEIVKGSQRGLHPIKIEGTTHRYEVITVDGVTDIIEHRKREPIFYINDNLDVWKQLNVPK